MLYRRTMKLRSLLIAVCGSIVLCQCGGCDTKTPIAPQPVEKKQTSQVAPALPEQHPDVGTEPPEIAKNPQPPDKTHPAEVKSVSPERPLDLSIPYSILNM